MSMKPKRTKLDRLIKQYGVDFGIKSDAGLKKYLIRQGVPSLAKLLFIFDKMKRKKKPSLEPLDLKKNDWSK